MDVDEKTVADTASACKRQKRNNSIDEEACNEDGGDEDTAKSATSTTTTTVENETVTEESVEAAAGAGGDADLVPKLVGRNRTTEENETVNSCNTNNNNNNNIDIGEQKKQQTSESIIPSFFKELTDAIINDSCSEDSTSSEEQQPAATTSASATSATAAQGAATATAQATGDGALANNAPARRRAVSLAIFQAPLPDNVLDSDDAEAEPNSTRFNRPRRARTYAYRSNVSNSDSNSTDDTEVENGHVAESNRTRRVRLYTYRESPTNSDSSILEFFARDDTDDTEVEHNGEGDDDEDDDADSAAAAANVERESLSPAFAVPEESSSDSSVAFWNRYYTSSNEDVDSDDDFNESVANSADKEQIERNVNKVMCKSKPSYSWNFDQELMQRENQLFNRIGWRGGHTSSQSFGRGYYGSRQVVERLKLLKVMSRHTGCVNCLNFNSFGDLICSGSDDLSIHVWDWANGKPRHSFKSGHSYNIFQTKFIDSAGCLDIVSSSRDGQVRRAVIPPSGSSSIKPVRLYSHNDAVHKLVVVPQSRHEIMSAGEDAAIKHYDLRTNTSTTMLRCVDDKQRVRLFSISHHPYSQEFCISGSDDKLRVYDKRRLPKSVHVMTPKELKDTKITQITCAVYNHSGSEILASYSDAGIYLYDSRNYQEGQYLHLYEGHINSRTIKGVNFFGPHSEYIVSGSDCGHIFFWDKNTEAVINFMKGDDAGVVNCLEPHPSMPVLATSGLEHNVKIWTPNGGASEKGQCTDGLKATLQRNFRRSMLDVGDFDMNHIHYFVRQLVNPLASGVNAAMTARRQMGRRHELFASSSSNSSSSSSSGGGGTTSRILISDPSPPAAAQGEEPNRDSNASSSDEGIADPLGCRSQ